MKIETYLNPVWSCIIDNLPKLLKTLIFALPVGILIYFSIRYVWLFNLTDWSKRLISCVFILPALYYFINYFVYLMSIKKSARRPSKIHLFTDNNSFFNTLFSLLFFYSTFFIGLLIFQEKPSEGEIPYLKDGMVGMRAWHSEVEVKNIKIYYFDSNQIWTTIPDSVIYNKENWQVNHWNVDKIREEIIKYDGILEIGNKLRDLDYFVITDKSLKFANCVPIFYPDEGIPKVFHNVKFICEVKFLRINEPKDSIFPGFQILTFIDSTVITYKKLVITDNKATKLFSDVCLQFNLGMNNDHHPWIPGFDFEPPVKYHSSINKSKRYGNFNSMEQRKTYAVSAIIYNDMVLFQGHEGGTVKLFEATMERQKPLP